MKNSKLSSKTVRKMFAFATAVALFTGVCTGCEKKTTDKNDSGQTVIKVGGWPAQEGAERDNYMKRKAKFEKDNPDYVIEPDLWTFDLKSFYSKAAGNTLPTIYNCYFTEMPQIKSLEYSKELTKAFKDNGLEGKFNPKILEAVSDEKGNIYGFPYSAYMLGLAYNVDLFEQAGLMETDGTPKQPKTWEELAKFAVQIKEKTGKAGFVFPSMNNYGGWIFMPVAWSYGVDFMEQDSNGKWKATFDTEEAAEALQFIKDLKWKYDVIPSNTLVDNTEYYKLFSIGSAGMLISSSGVANQAKQYGMDPNHLGMMGLPAGPKRHVTLLGGNVFCIANNSTDAQADGAVKWIKMQHTYETTDDYKTNLEAMISASKEQNKLIGLRNFDVWNEDTESVKLYNETIEKNTNVNINHIRLFNEFLSSDVEVQAEEPVCAQELYATLDGCIQEVWSNKNADCAEILKKANADFQSNYLNNVDY